MVGLLDRAGHGDAWHGPSVDAVFSTLTAAQAAMRPIADGHTIWELALHIAQWDRIVARRLAGEIVDPSPAEDWPRPGEPSDEAWKRAVVGLRESRDVLRAALLGFSDDRLQKIVQGKNYTFHVMIHGVIQHALYHAGQAALLRKAVA